MGAFLEEEGALPCLLLYRQHPSGARCILGPSESWLNDTKASVAHSKAESLHRVVEEPRCSGNGSLSLRGLTSEAFRSCRSQLRPASRRALSSLAAGPGAGIQVWVEYPGGAPGAGGWGGQGEGRG